MSLDPFGRHFSIFVILQCSDEFCIDGKLKGFEKGTQSEFDCQHCDSTGFRMIVDENLLELMRQ